MKRLLFAVLLGMALPAAAQYPNRTVTMLTGYPAGGLVDIVARMVAENMKPRFPAGLVVVNRPGAAGAVAVGELTRAAPDGYTIILTPHSALTIAPQINDLPYKTPDDYDPFINLVAYYPLIAVRTESKVQDDPGAALRREGQSRDAPRRHAGRGHLEPPQPRGADASRRRQDGARPVRGMGAVERRGARRPSRGGGRSARGAQAHGRRQAHARAREFHAQAPCGVPRRADGEGARLGRFERASGTC
jgi:hypothetical protein